MIMIVIKSQRKKLIIHQTFIWESVLHPVWVSLAWNFLLSHISISEHAVILESLLFTSSGGVAILWENLHSRKMGNQSEACRSVKNMFLWWFFFIRPSLSTVFLFLNHWILSRKDRQRRQVVFFLRNPIEDVLLASKWEVSRSAMLWARPAVSGNRAASKRLRFPTLGRSCL